MNKSKKIDPYFINRTSITGNMDNRHLLEVEGLCPLCGKFLLGFKGKRTNKLYQIAHIYPNSPLPAETIELSGLERLGENCEEFENKIALCKDCHGYYDDHKTKSEYSKLIGIKKKLLERSKMLINTSFQDLEKEIAFLIEALSKIDTNSLQKIELEYHALKISNKIDGKHNLLRLKVENYVCIYFNYIDDTFKNLDQSGKLNFNIIASEIRTSFLKCESETTNKSEIFNSLVNWLQSQITDSLREPCEVLLSYFVQKCEVFNEITE